MIYNHHLNPIALSLGPLNIAWYGLMYALSFLIAYVCLLRLARNKNTPFNQDEASDLLTYIMVGVILGGRLGWVLFYGGAIYWQQPWRILEIWKGGMSFHGGLLGCLGASWWFCRKKQFSWPHIADILTILAPIGLFFGRVGNFINGELYGRPTAGNWGVVFPSDAYRLPRHPSQLYEALLEGPILLLFLLGIQRLHLKHGAVAACFVLGYGMARFAIEFVRLPDAHLGYLWLDFTMGQWLSLPMMLLGIVWLRLCLQKSKL